MNEFNQTNGGDNAPSGQAGSSAENGNELELLRQRVHELEQANEQCRRELASVQAERDLWQKESLAWAVREMDRTDPLTPERVEQMIREETWLPFETIWEDLERGEEGQ